jgi:tRNA(Ile)-lysidine synthase
VREKVLRYIRKHSLMRAGDRVAAAVSGGADSVALLQLLRELRPELGIVLAVAHFNHGLREQAAADEAFVGELARQHELEFIAGRGDVRDHALTCKLSIEAAARELRYQWFARVALEQRLDCIATAHTQDDQAETVLMKFLRGAGTRGLAGIYPQLELCGAGASDAASSDAAGIRIVRPLLCVTRAEVEAYLTALGQSWREDESNLDRRFLRNRVRHDLLPLLEREYNPNLRRQLRDAAEIARGEEEYWEPLVKEALAASARDNELRLEGFAGLPFALQRRIVKRWAEGSSPALDFHQVESLRRCAVGELRRATMPGGRLAVVANGYLKICVAQQHTSCDYEYMLPVPGDVDVPELGIAVRALPVAEEFARESPQGTLLDSRLIGTQLLLRNWRHGDRYRPAHRGSEEKLKRLFAEKKIPVEQRATWPVALHEGEIVWVRGFPVAAAYEWRGIGDAVKIEVRSVH